MKKSGGPAESEPEPIREKWTIRNVLSKLIGITPEYTN